MVYVPGVFTSALPEVVTATLPAQVSLAVAPGSVKLVWHSTVTKSVPLSLIAGGVVSLTVRIVVAVLLLPAASVAVTVIVCAPSPTSVPAAGLCVSLTEPQLSEAVVLETTSGIATWQALSVVAEVGAGALTFGGVWSMTVIVCVALAVLPPASVAV